MKWQLAEAKNRFSEVVNRALAEGPQFVYRRKDSVVVVARRDFERLMGRRPSLDGLDLSRDRSAMRDALSRNCAGPNRMAPCCVPLRP
jgi:antitoxin Phd